MIIDSHTHLDIFCGKILPPEQMIKKLKEIMKKAKVDHSIIITCIKATTKRNLPTEKVLKLTEGEKCFSVACGISIAYTSEELKRLRQLLSERRIVAVKLYPGYEPFYPSDKRCSPVYDLCEDFDIPVIFHSGETLGKGAGIKYALPLHIDDLAIARPKLKIIIAHMGNPWTNETMAIMARNKNVYADISGLLESCFDDYWKRHYGDIIVRLLKWDDNNRNGLLFGTDWPCNDSSLFNKFTKSYVEFAKELKISKKDKEIMFSLNAKRLFKI